MAQCIACTIQNPIFNLKFVCKRFECREMGSNGLVSCLAYLFFLVGLSCATTMKILTNHPKVFPNPHSGSRESKNNLFGTSIGLSDTSKSIYVGAPKYSYGGGLYSCNIPNNLDDDPQCQLLDRFKKYGK